MRILLISEAFGGIATYSEQLIREFNKTQGIETRTVWLFNQQNDQGENIRKFIPQARTILSLRNPKKFKDPLMQIISQDSSDIIHFQHDMNIFPSRDNFLALLREIRSQTRKKAVITLHSVYTEPSFLELLRDVLLLSDAYIVHQENAKDFLRSKGMDPEKIFVIPHGSTRIESQPKRMCFFEGKSFKIAMVGFLKRTKGFEEVLSSIITKKDLEIVIAGMIKEVEVVRHITELRGEANATMTIIPRFLTDQELIALITEADCIILPYNQNYFSASGILHLAIGLGKIVLVSSSPKFKELTERIPFCNVKNGNYLKHIEVLQTSPEMKTQLSQKLALFAKDTSWPLVARKTIRLYQKVLRMPRN
ncbi:MAG: glycosyltransferase [Candidatus Heimdallarchaeota archaeon]